MRLRANAMRPWPFRRPARRVADRRERMVPSMRRPTLLVFAIARGYLQVMLLVFLRHGPAGHADSSRWPDDRERPLTTKGIERTRRAAKGLTRLTGRIDRVW